ncbi:MAG: hypothetical protein HY706_05180, partial [Candidatus Hydrogenedentes bacterium]|nr:hypothetical protein [Candidatus Hydrogenedentota bacterium]
TQFLKLGRQCFQDAVEDAVRTGPANGPPRFLDFVIEHKERVQGALDRWEVFHKGSELPTLSDEGYLERVASLAEEAGYDPLAAMIQEHQVARRERKGLPANGKTELEQKIHPLYKAASLYLSQGNRERDAGAFDLALRRYDKSAGLLMKIGDRTSTARVLVERARAVINSGGDPESLVEGLNQAAGLVLAHVRNLPQGVLPEVSQEAALHFFRDKGYHIEAEAYAAGLEKLKVAREA